jgi:hypothetical protein
MARCLNFSCIVIVCFLVPMCFAPLQALTETSEDFQIGTGVSGSWYTPSRSGEGFFVQALDEHRVVVYWFTYSAHSATQAWLVGNGTLSANSIHIPVLYITSGPVFGEDFNPDDLSLEPWGELSIRFDSCDTAELSYQGLDGTDTRLLARLTGVSGTDCSFELNQYSHLSGSWFDSARNGEGWILQQFTEQDYLVTWFTYNATGQQAWMTGLGQMSNEQLEFRDLLITHGTLFGDGFNPLDVVQEHWGDIYFSFANCDNGYVDYESHNAPPGKGNRRFERLTRVSGIDCDDTNQLTIDRGSWQRQTMPFNRLGARAAAIGDLIYMGGGFGQANRFDRFDPQTGEWQRLANIPDLGRTRHAMVVHENAFYVFGGIRGGNWTTLGQTSVLKYLPGQDEWTEIAPLPASVHTGAAVSVGNSIYILAGHRAGFWRFDPTAQEYFPLPDLGIRIGARLLLFKGEIWVIGGYDHVADVNEVKIFNPVDETWRDGPPLNDLRAGFAAQVMHGQIVVVGGEVTIGTPPRLIDQVEVLASEETGWVAVPGPAFPIYDAASAAVGGRLYIFGGGNVANTLNSTNHLQIYTPATD